MIWDYSEAIGDFMFRYGITEALVAGALIAWGVYAYYA